VSEKPLEGWKEIASEMGRGEKACARWADRPRDPLPVLWYEGRVLAYPSALGAWRERNTHPLQVARQLARTSAAARDRPPVTPRDRRRPLTLAMPKKSRVS